MKFVSIVGISGIAASLENEPYYTEMVEGMILGATDLSAEEV